MFPIILAGDRGLHRRPHADDAEPQGAAFSQAGEASWHELMTTDAPATMAFYSEVFGWQPGDAMDKGPMGTYHIFYRSHGMVGGMMTSRPSWRTCRRTG